MKALHLVLTALLAFLVVAGVAAARPDVPDPIWVLKCIGDSLNGAACHG